MFIALKTKFAKAAQYTPTVDKALIATLGALYYNTSHVSR